MAGEWTRFGYGPPPTIDLAEYVGNVRAAGLDRAVFTGRIRMDRGELVAGVPNDYVAECVSQHPEIIIGFAGADATTGQIALDEIRRACGVLGLKGVSLDPAHSQSSPADKQFYPLYELCVELGVPIVLTMGPLVNPIASDPGAIDRIARDFPTQNFICSHGCWPRTDELIALAYRFDNVFLEASIYQYMPGAEPFLEAARDLLQDKVVYASAFPFNSLSSIDKLISVGRFSDEVAAKVLGGNAGRLLGLSSNVG